MKKLIRIALLTLVLVCLLAQAAFAQPVMVVSGGNLRPNPGPAVRPNEIIDAIGQELNEPGHFSWVPSVMEVEDAKEPIDAEDVYVSPATGVGAAAMVTCISAAGLAIVKLTKKKEQ